jgi:hypothetical protein
MSIPLVFNEAADRPFASAGPRDTASQTLVSIESATYPQTRLLPRYTGGAGVLACAETAVPHAFPFVLGFSTGRLLMRNWVRFAIFRIGSQMASFRKLRAAKATPRTRMIARLYFTGAATLASHHNGSRLLIMKWLITNWVRFVIFRIGCQMALFRKLRAAKANPRTRMIARLHFTGVPMLPWPRNGSRLLIMKWLTPNWVRFVIFRIGCQMASFRKHALPRPHGEFA